MCQWTYLRQCRREWGDILWGVRLGKIAWPTTRQPAQVGGTVGGVVGRYLVGSEAWEGYTRDDSAACTGCLILVGLVLQAILLKKREIE